MQILEKRITLYSFVSVLGTIGGAFTIIFTCNRLLNMVILKRQFKKDFVNDMRKHQLKNRKEEDAETKDQINI